MRNSFATAVVICLALTVVTSTGSAQEVRQIPLEPASKPSGQLAPSGQVTCTESADSYTCTARISGVQPNGVFTTWLVNMKPKMEMDQAGEKFAADASGKAQASFRVPKPAFEKWQMLVIALHPDGDASNMKDHVDVLKAPLKATGKTAPRARATTPVSSPTRTRPMATPVGTPS